MQNVFRYNQLNNVNTCSKSELTWKNVYYTQNINEFTDFI